MTAWTPPGNWSGSPAESYFNTHIRDNLNYLFENLHSGSSTAGWASFTPSWTNITVGNGTSTGKKGYAGKTTHFYAELTFGSTTSVSGAVALGFPDTAVTYLAHHPVGIAILRDVNVTTNYKGVAIWSTTAAMAIHSLAVSGSNVVTAALSSTAPFTWATGDFLFVAGSYERA
jgi:hypothetical protein